MATLSPFPELRSLCYKCIELQLPTADQCKELRLHCNKCGRPYGEKHASKIDSRFCEECLNDFQVTRQDWINAGVEVSHEPILDDKGKPVLDKDGKPLTRERRRPYSVKAKQIILFGQDWIFNEIRISQLSLEQLQDSIEWHKANVSLMEAEITRHKIERAHKLAQVRVPVADRSKLLAEKKKEQNLQMLAESLGSKLKPAELQELIKKLGGGIK